MSDSFVTKEPTLNVITSKELVAERLCLFTALKGKFWWPQIGGSSCATMVGNTGRVLLRQLIEDLILYNNFVGVCL